MARNYISLDRPPKWLVSELQQKADEFGLKMEKYAGKILKHAIRHKADYDAVALRTNPNNEQYFRDVNIPANDDLKKRLSAWAGDDRGLGKQAIYVLQKSLNLPLNPRDLK